MFECSELKAFRIESEPGDATRYSYVVLKTEWDYKIISYNTEFKLPKLINRYSLAAVNDLLDAVVWMKNHNDIPEYAGVNPHTLLEVCNSIRRLVRENILPDLK